MPGRMVQSLIPDVYKRQEFRLTPIQEALLPHWLETCRNLNNDLAALAFRLSLIHI